MGRHVFVSIPTIKGAIRQHCFVYIKPFNFVNSQNDFNAILSYPVMDHMALKPRG